MLQQIAELLFPRKCLFCRKVLSREETDLCHSCRQQAPEFTKSKINFSFVARWTAVWYYKENARRSILRYKFYNQRSYAAAYGQMLAMKLLHERMDDFDVLTWVPVAPLRRFVRGFDQVELLSHAVARELGCSDQKVLKKVRNTPPQSGLKDAARRRANVLNAYRVIDPAAISGKRILLLDDIVTTGATASECARTLLTAGAKQVCLAAMATAIHERK